MYSILMNSFKERPPGVQALIDVVTKNRLFDIRNVPDRESRVALLRKREKELLDPPSRSQMIAEIARGPAGKWANHEDSKIFEDIFREVRTKNSPNHQLVKRMEMRSSSPSEMARVSALAFARYKKHDSHLRAAVVGATGMAGQQFLPALDNHPWIRVTALAASAQSAGKKFVEAITAQSGNVGWFCKEPIPAWARDMTIQNADELNPSKYDVIFTAVEKEVSMRIEPTYAQETPVFSTSAAFRYQPDVSLVIPGVNDDHIGLFAVQRRNRGWRGFIAPNPNCTTVGLATALKPVYDKFGIKFVSVTTLQSVSGAGRVGGVLALDILNNVLPFIRDEEKKVREETKKILGRHLEGKIDPADFSISVTCTRVPVAFGHFETVMAVTEKEARVEDVIAAYEARKDAMWRLGLPSAPEKTYFVYDDPLRPQPVLDADMGDGMTTAIGRVRVEPDVQNGISFVLLSHNLKLGAAKGCVLAAEYFIREGYI